MYKVIQYKTVRNLTQNIEQKDSVSADSLAHLPIQQHSVRRKGEWLQCQLYSFHCAFNNSISLLIVNNVHCTLYTIHCTMYTVHCTLYTVHSTLYNIQC